jgi:hypothetical protein
MNNSKTSINQDGTLSLDTEFKLKIRNEIDARLSEFSLAYANCKCDTCRISVINQMQDVVEAEIYYWHDTLQAPIEAGENIEEEAFDNSFAHIVALYELIEDFNSIRQILSNP